MSWTCLWPISLYYVEYKPQKSTWEAEVSFTEELLHSKHEALAALHKENQDYEQEVEDYKMKICDRYGTKTNFSVEKCIVSY